MVQNYVPRLRGNPSPGKRGKPKQSSAEIQPKLLGPRKVERLKENWLIFVWNPFFCWKSQVVCLIVILFLGATRKGSQDKLWKIMSTKPWKTKSKSLRNHELFNDVLVLSSQKTKRKRRHPQKNPWIWTLQVTRNQLRTLWRRVSRDQWRCCTEDPKSLPETCKALGLNHHRKQNT